MKRILKIVVAVVVLVVVALAVAWLYIDSIAKTAVERGATYALGVDTRVDSVNLSLLKGTVRIDGLTVANPGGFKTPHLMKTGRFDIAVVPGTITKDVIELSRFELDGLDLNIEQKLGTGSNISVLLDHIKTPGGGQKETPKEEGGRTVKVDRIVIRNVVAHVQVLPVGGQATTLDVKVPEIVMNDVTSDNASGVAVSELVRRLFPAILAAVVDKGKGILPDADLKQLGDRVAATTQALGAGAAKVVEQAGQGVGKLLDIFKKKPEGEGPAAEPKKDLGDALKDLFKKKEPDAAK